MKYDYKGASALYDEFRNWFTDPWDLSDMEWQENRREFLRAFTRRSDAREQYIEYARDWVDSCYPYLSERDLIGKCERIIQKMVEF